MYSIDITNEEGTVWGYIQYDKDTKELYIEFPDAKLKELVKKHLTDAREYYIVQSNGIDDDHTIKTVAPSSNFMNLRAALCELRTYTNVIPIWATEKGVSKEGP